MADVSRKGVFQGDLVTLLKLIQTNFNGINAKLDADAGVTDTDYASLWDLSNPDVTVEAAGTGLGNANTYEFIKEFFTNYNGVMAKLNADATVNDTDYATLTNTVGELLRNFVSISQTDIITSLQTFITAIATSNAKLDADSGVTDTNYAATYDVTDTVDDSGA